MPFLILEMDSRVAWIMELSSSILLSEFGVMASAKRIGSKRYNPFTSPFLPAPYFLAAAPELFCSAKRGYKLFYVCLRQTVTS